MFDEVIKAKHTLFFLMGSWRLKQIDLNQQLVCL